MDEPIKALGVQVHKLGMSAGIPGIGAFAQLHNHVRSLRPDVIQGWMYHGNLAASLAARLTPRRPTLVWNVRHCLYDLGNEKPLTRQVIRATRMFSSLPDAIVYNSRLSREQHERFGFCSRKGVIIPNGFDPSLLRPNPEVGLAVRRDIGVDSWALVVGHVARFHPMKDHANFLRAAVEVARRVPEARFLLVGREVSPGNPELSGIIPADLLPRFVFTGERPNVAPLIQAMNILCSSSWSEAFPNVLGEAMACGVPCVATDVGDSAHIVGDTGLIVPPRDSKALSKALIELLQKAPGELRMLGLAARRRIHDNYSLNRIIDLYTSIYNETPSILEIQNRFQNKETNDRNEQG